MRDDATIPLFLDGIEDALREVVRSAGGMKPVGGATDAMRAESA